MNEETVLESEIQTVSTIEPTSSEDETEVGETDHGLVTSEAAPAESKVTESTFEVLQDDTVPETTELITVEVIESLGSDIVHADLFGSFLICGTLIGLSLLRKIYGT